MPCTTSPTQILGTALPNTLCPNSHPLPPKPLPCSLSDAFDGFHAWEFFACLSCHLLQDMALIHGILDLWIGGGWERPSAGLLTASLTWASLLVIPVMSYAQPLPSSSLTGETESPAMTVMSDESHNKHRQLEEPYEGFGPGKEELGKASRRR